LKPGVAVAAAAAAAAAALDVERQTSRAVSMRYEFFIELACQRIVFGLPGMFYSQASARMCVRFACKVHPCKLTAQITLVTTRNGRLFSVISWVFAVRTDT